MTVNFKVAITAMYPRIPEIWSRIPGYKHWPDDPVSCYWSF